MANSYMYVPAVWIRPDTLSPASAKAGYACLNDKTSPLLEPILEDDYLTKVVVGNLTVGFYSGQGNASDGCPSRLDFKKPRAAKLRADLKAWALLNGVSDTARPSVAQGVDLVYKFIPLMYGAKVVRDVLARFWTIVTSSAKTSGTGLGKTGWLNAVIEQLNEDQAFIRARPGKSMALPSAVEGTPAPVAPTAPITPPATPVHRNIPGINPDPTMSFLNVASPSTPTPTYSPARKTRAVFREEEAGRKAIDEELAQSIRDETDARRAADLDEAKTRQAEDAALARQIRREAAERHAADLAEAKIRQAKDEELAQNFRAEAAVREAADQAEAAKRSAADAAEAKAREAADAELRKQIVQEALTRMHENNRIQDSVRAEETARQLEDANLKARIAEETNSRTHAMKALAARIAAEKASAHQAAIDAAREHTRHEARTRSTAIRQEAATRAAQTARLQELIVQESTRRTVDVESLRKMIHDGTKNGDIRELKTLDAELKKNARVAEQQGQTIGRMGVILHNIVQEMVAAKKSAGLA